jgi:hypothetical protein
MGLGLQQWQQLVGVPEPPRATKARGCQLYYGILTMKRREVKIHWRRYSREEGIIVAYLYDNKKTCEPPEMAIWTLYDGGWWSRCWWEEDNIDSGK